MAAKPETLSVKLRLSAPLEEAAWKSTFFRHVGALVEGSPFVRFASLRRGGARSLVRWLEEHEVRVAEVMEMHARGLVTPLGVLDGLPLEMSGEPLLVPERPWRGDLIYAVGGDRYVVRTKLLEHLYAEGDQVFDVRADPAERSTTWREWRCADETGGILDEDPFDLGEHLGLFVQRDDAPALEGITLERWGWPAFLGAPERTVRPVVLGPRVAAKLRNLDAKIVAPVLRPNDWPVTIARALVGLE